MKNRTMLAASACAILALTAPVFAQDHGSFQLPEQCSGTAVSEASPADVREPVSEHGADHAMIHGGEASDGKEGEMPGHDMALGESAEAPLPEHVRQNMAKMRVTMSAMEKGMMQQDADIAFACGMIAHHQAAIDMANVVLEHGQDAQLRRLAEEIVELQTAEIEVMTEWLETSAE